MTLKVRVLTFLCLKTRTQEPIGFVNFSLIDSEHFMLVLNVDILLQMEVKTWEVF